jgi:2-oxoglutarate dehydrogenase E2 component (dihydrolipoamide succinyltransferase)
VRANAGALNLEALYSEMRRVAAAARDRQLRPRDGAAPTFTISNAGALGAVEAPAIVVLPQVATLGLGATVRTPRAVIGADGLEAVAIRPMMRLALSYDHRALDGGDALRYLSEVKRGLETWEIADYQK